MIKVEKDLHTINRKTDNILDWLGGWGGLLDGLNYIAKYLLSSYSFYSLNRTLSSRLVRYVPSSKTGNKSKDSKQ